MPELSGFVSQACSHTQYPPQGSGRVFVTFNDENPVRILWIDPYSCLVHCVCVICYMIIADPGGHPCLKKVCLCGSYAKVIV